MAAGGERRMLGGCVLTCRGDEGEEMEEDDEGRQERAHWDGSGGMVGRVGEWVLGRHGGVVVYRTGWSHFRGIMRNG